MSMRDVNFKRLTICEVLRSINDRLQGAGHMDVRDMLALAEQMAKKMSGKLVEYSKKHDAEWWEENPEYVDKVNRELETYLAGDAERAKMILQKSGGLNRGIMFVVFGHGYDNLAAQTIAYSRQHIMCPITVLTNLKERSAKWDSIKGIDFIYIDADTEENRRAKIELYKYTPYDETLYVDCDSIFIKDGIEKIFNQFKGNNLILQYNSMPCWKEDTRFFKIYRDAAKQLGAVLPLNIYQGGIFAFRKTDETVRFFTLWKNYWQQLGSGRDMPAFACAVQKSEVKHSIVSAKEHKFFIFGNNSDVVINHPTGKSVLSKFFNIDYCKPNKPFDVGRQEDWKMVFFDEKEDALLSHPWILKKFDREKRIADKERYIDNYLPEIKKGGLDILDIATGPGEMLELAEQWKNNPVGIEYCSGMFKRENDFLYEQYNILRHKEKNLRVIYTDINDLIICSAGYHRLSADTGPFDIINCQHAINFIARHVFNNHPEREYKNDGEWIFNDEFDLFFNRYFQWCRAHLKSRGVVMLAALRAVNEKEYSARVQAIGVANGFTVEISARDLNHKFMLAV
jgi:hypothetical protein